MNLFRLAWVQFKRMIKDIKIVGIMLIMPIVVVSATYLISVSSPESQGTEVAFDVRDKGEYAQKLLESLKFKTSIYYNYGNKAMESLQNNKVAVVYSIPEDFTEKIKEGKKPTITAYKREKGNGTLLIEEKINSEINKLIKKEILIKYGALLDGDVLSENTIKVVFEGKEKIQDGLFYTLLLVVNFIVFSASSLGVELLALKKARILARAISTANKGWEIIGSLYLAMFFLQIGIYTTVILVEKFIIGYSLKNFFIVFINICLICLFSLSLGIFITRIFENEGVASLVTTLVGISTIFISIAGLGLHSDKGPWIIDNLAKFTPQYWALHSIMNGSIFPNIFVIILMALVLFTAGNIKLNNFVNR